MDRIWGHIADMKPPGIVSTRFAQLAEVAKLVLTIPHSNAGEERVVSVIRKIGCDDRAKFQLEGTLSSLVTVKFNLPESKAQPCYTFKPSKELLQKATSYYNNEVCSSCDNSSSTASANANLLVYLYVCVCFVCSKSIIVCNDCFRVWQNKKI